MSERVAVYLGASQPVHRTHTKLVRALLDAGHDRVFVFLLRWRPERFGISADTAAEHLRKWLAELPPSDLARVILEVVQHDHEGGSRMRAILGPDANPEVEVCFSRKYETQLERIQSDWLPIYAREFPSAKPQFLSEDTDPGGNTSAGTAAFAEALRKFREAQGAPEASDAAMAELEQWRPEHETATGWRAYVEGLLAGSAGEPFYTPADKVLLDEAFFSDADMLQSFSALGLPSPAGEFLKLPKNQGTFWKKHATATEEALWKQFCVRRQLGRQQSSAVEFPPRDSRIAVGSAIDAIRRGNQKRYVILAAPSSEKLGEALAAADPGRMEYHKSKWNKFPDGTDNITLGGFAPEDRVSGRDVLFLASFDSNETTMSQLHALNYLCETAFLTSLTILLAFLPSGTMERTLQPGRIATANSHAKIISQMPPTGGARTRVMIYDVHSPPTQFFFTGSCSCTLHTACPLILNKISSMDPTMKIDCIAFPDDGATKRFSKFFEKNLHGVEIVTCCKKRITMTTREVQIFDGGPSGKHVLIMDDLIQSGGTLYECAVRLREAGAKTVSGFVVHAVFPKESWRRFLKDGDRTVFDRFWLTNSNPGVTMQIPDGDVFEVIDLTQQIVRDL
ncbi:unnamed protein product [Polarella glacialis]|uniref:Phosphoribosyltransferase domain-containing protein n=1 Tax=Polarella glacialis TaxID=89957 RepID=A0A813GTI7_POLGL|nr:unnamed protein product [Polarella glacialis]CAE8707730.1 unnamed protein product [Polarella glacialis]